MRGKKRKNEKKRRKKSRKSGRERGGGGKEEREREQELEEQEKQEKKKQEYQEKTKNKNKKNKMAGLPANCYTLLYFFLYTLIDALFDGRFVTWASQLVGNTEQTRRRSSCIVHLIASLVSFASTSSWRWMFLFAISSDSVMHWQILIKLGRFDNKMLSPRAAKRTVKFIFKIEFRWMNEVIQYASNR